MVSGNVNVGGNEIVSGSLQVGGGVAAASANISGALTAGSISTSGAFSPASITTSSLTATTANVSGALTVGGQIHGASGLIDGDLSAATLHSSGDATVGGLLSWHAEVRPVVNTTFNFPGPTTVSLPSLGVPPGGHLFITGASNGGVTLNLTDGTAPPPGTYYSITLHKTPTGGSVDIVTNGVGLIYGPLLSYMSGAFQFTSLSGVGGFNNSGFVVGEDLTYSVELIWDGIHWSIIGIAGGWHV